MKNVGFVPGLLLYDETEHFTISTVADLLSPPMTKVKKSF
jgi:hypothetical protein